MDFGELQKNLCSLQAYKEDGQITLEDIEEVVPQNPLQDNIFDLTQMIPPNAKSIKPGIWWKISAYKEKMK